MGVAVTSTVGKTCLEVETSPGPSLGIRHLDLGLLSLIPSLIKTKWKILTSDITLFWKLTGFQCELKKLES